MKRIFVVISKINKFCCFYGKNNNKLFDHLQFASQNIVIKTILKKHEFSTEEMRYVLLAWKVQNFIFV